MAAITRAVWALCEFVRLRREVRQTTNHDQHSSQLWDVAICLEVIGMLLGFLGIGRMHGVPTVIAPAGLVVMILGIVIRWSAILTLGRYFTGRVLIQPGHQLVRKGLYKYVRHPAYIGSLLAHAGLGLSFSNWLTLGLSFVPFVIAVWYRMRVEDAALQKAFGVAYLDYSKEAKRLIPRVYWLIGTML
jgi:protein-S-isoprenylcysteine O-methyltransferase